MIARGKDGGKGQGVCNGQVHTVIYYVSEVSKKKKDKYHIVMYTHGIQKDGTDEPIIKVAMETQTERTDLWIRG